MYYSALFYTAEIRHPSKERLLVFGIEQALPVKMVTGSNL